MTALAHDVPRDVTVTVYLKPEGGKLTMLVRAPLEAMRDIEFPQRGLGYLDLDAVAPQLDDAAQLWLAGAIEMKAGGTTLARPRTIASRLSVQADRSFASFDEALGHMSAPRLTNQLNIFWRQALLDVHFEYALTTRDAPLILRSKLARLGLRVVTRLSYLKPGDPPRQYEFTGDPGEIAMEPSASSAIARFLRFGVSNGLARLDLWLAISAVLLGVANWRSGLASLGGLAIASLASSFAAVAGWQPGALWFPPFADALAWIMILALLLDAIVRGEREDGRLRWAWLAGLASGFGVASGSAELLQFAGDHRGLATASLVVGAAAALLVASIAAIIALAGARRAALMNWPRLRLVIGAIVAHHAWHQAADRASLTAQYQIAFAFDATTAALALRWALVVTLVGGAIWVLDSVAGPRSARSKSSVTAR